MASSPNATARERSTATEIAPPRFATAWASLVYAVSTLLLGYPALMGQVLLNPRSDQYLAGFAFRDFAAQHLKSGHGFPQWNPFIEGGLPYIGAMHGDIFYPTFLLRMVMPTDMAMTWEFVIHTFLCGLFTYLFLRAWNFGFYGALVGGLAYLLGGSIAGFAGPGHDGKLFVSTMLPLALFFVTRGVRDARTWAWGGLAITIGLAVLSPHPQLLQYLLLTSGAFALYVAFSSQSGRGRLPTKTAIGRLAAAFGSVVVGMLIGAIQYWPALFEYKPWSPRAQGHDLATATSYSFPIEELINSYWPQFSGILDNYWGRNFIHFHSDYFGVVVLILFGAAFGQTTVKSFRRFWIGAGIISLIWAFGGFTPFYSIILAIPLFGAKYFRAPSTMIFVTAFSVSVLAAIGMERLIARKVSPKYAIAWVAAALGFGVLMSIGGYTALSNAVIGTFSGMQPGATEYLSQQASNNAGAALVGVWRSFLFTALAAGVIWAFLTSRIAPRAATLTLVALLIVDLWTVERLYWFFSPRASVLYATDPAIEAIKADMAKSGQWSRIWTSPLSSGVVARDPTFDGDAMMSHDLRLIGNYHGNELGMYQELLAQANLSASLRTPIFAPPFWRHENVGYLYTGADSATIHVLSDSLRLTTPMTRIAGPVRNAAGSMVYAYKLPGGQTPAWVAAAMVKAPENQALATVLDSRFDPGRVAIVDTSAAQVQVAPLQGLPEPSGIRATVTASTDGSYDISLDKPATAGSALVVSENYFPGWTATVDGKPAPVVRANYNLIGIPLPAGAKTVELRFTDAAYKKGKVLTLVALAAAVIVLIAGVALSRRRTAV